jgi:hypothetical protein
VAASVEYLQQGASALLFDLERAHKCLRIYESS